MGDLLYVFFFFYYFKNQYLNYTILPLKVHKRTRFKTRVEPLNVLATLWQPVYQEGYLRLLAERDLVWRTSTGHMLSNQSPQKALYLYRLLLFTYLHLYIYLPTYLSISAYAVYSETMT